MGTCDCGSETDWTEINGTWLCVACRAEEIEKLAGQLKEELQKMEQAELSLLRLRVNARGISDLLSELKQEINKISVT